MPDQTAQRGFTLIEAVMVIMITGIIGAVVAVFIKSPIDAYFDLERRAALADEADTAVRRMARDIRTALPNSVRVSGSTCLELIPTKTGGRYRTEVDTAGLGNPLNFAGADTAFDMMALSSSLPVEQRIASGDVIAVYNLGIAGADAYAGDNTSAVSGAPAAGALSGETTISIASKQFPLESGSNRFHVIPKDEQTISYVCSGQNLYRVARSNISSAMRCTTTGGSLLASHLATSGGCSFYYTGSDLERNALVQIMLGLTDGGESVNLYHEVHVNNTP